MIISIKSTGSFKHLESFLDRITKGVIFDGLDAYGLRGVDALSNATPRESGETAESWRYKIIRNRGFISIEWYNTHQNQGQQIAVLIQYGHGTGTGGYVQGRDYINPAMRPIFDKIADDIWKKVRT